MSFDNLRLVFKINSLKYYLDKNLNFVTSIDDAGVFSFIKLEDGDIYNGDSVMISCANKSVYIEDGKVTLSEHKHTPIIISAGSLEELAYNKDVSLVVDRKKRVGLKYHQNAGGKFLHHGCYGSDNHHYKFVLEDASVMDYYGNYASKEVVDTKDNKDIYIFLLLCAILILLLFMKPEDVPILL